jgi:hypothetical protein
MSKRLAFNVILLALLLGVTEGISYLVYVVNPLSMLGPRYYDVAFRNVQHPTGPEGWTLYGDGARPSDVKSKTVCGNAFGDSFTHSDEVLDSEAWARNLSSLLGCDVRNYGVGGFGTDQAVLRYERLAPAGKFVVLGVYREMLRRSLAASWVYYGGQDRTTLKPYFKFDGTSVRHVSLPTEFSLQSVRDHHDGDYFYRPYRVSFPYSVALARVAYFRLWQQIGTSSYVFDMRVTDPYRHPRARTMQLALMDRMRKAAQSANQRLVIVFFPTPDDAQNGRDFYAEFAHEYAQSRPDVCVVDTREALLASTAAGAFRAPKGHFTALGNEIIAAEVAKRILECGILQISAE